MFGLVVTFVVVLVAIALGILTRRVNLVMLRYGVIGLIAGIATGFVAAELMGILHWFAGVTFPNPTFTFGGVAFGTDTFLPAVLGLTGVAVGVTLAVIRKAKPPSL
jgi:hypothetical protein